MIILFEFQFRLSDLQEIKRFLFMDYKIKGCNFLHLNYTSLNEIIY